MKKKLSFLLVAFLAIAAYAGLQKATSTALIDYPTSKTGITLFSAETKEGAPVDGAENQVIYSTVKIKGTSTDCIYFGKSISMTDTKKYYAELSVEGGFKAGDVIAITGAISNKDNTGAKYAAAVFYDSDQQEVWKTQNFANVYDGETEPTEQTFTLTADTEKLFFGRYGNTGTNVVKISVSRESDEPEPVATKTIYLKPGEWTADNARFAAWAWGEGQDAAWYDLTVVEGATDYYEVAVPETTSGIVFVRMNPASSENIWGNAWNQTEDLEIGQNNLFKITGWGPQGGKSTCEAGTYPEEPTPPAEDVYTVAGAFYNSETAQGVFFGEPWTLPLEANNMVKGADGSETTYIKTYQDAELEAGNIQFKVYKNNNWNEGYPENNYELSVAKAGKYDLTITFNSETQEVTGELTSKTPIYTVTVADGIQNGTVSVDPTEYFAGEEVTVNTKPAEGFQLGTIMVTCETINQTVEVIDGKFTMPADNVTVTARFVPVEVVGYYVVGTMTDWAPADGYQLAQGTEEGTFTLTKEFQKDDEIKVVAKMSDNTTVWYPDGQDNFKIEESAEYTVTFNPKGGVDGWFGGFFTAVKTVPPVALKDFSVTFTTNRGWEKVFAYAWTGNTPIEAWPGEEITKSLSEGVYTYAFKAEEAPANIIFNNGLKDEALQQTDDLVFENGRAYEFNVAKYKVVLGDDQVYGTVEPNKYEAAEGEQVLLKVTPKDNYQIEAVSVIGDDQTPIETKQIVGGEYNYSFEMPAQNVTVSATFKKQGGDEPVAETETIEFTAAGTGTNPMVYTEDHFTYTFDKGSGSNNPAYVANAGETRLYAKGSLTIKANAGEKISKIVFDAAINANKNGVAPTIDGVAGTTAEGTWDAENWTWTGEDTEVQMSTSGSAGNVGFKSITVTFISSGDTPEPPVVINSMAIVGDFLGLEATDESNPNWDPANGWQMTQDATNTDVWTLKKENVVVEGKKYEYKAFANGETTGYQLPSAEQGNADFVFGTDKYPAGEYTLTFTANTKNHTLTLDVKKNGINTIKELNAQNNGTEFSFVGDAIVVATAAKGNAKYVYIKDDTGSSLIYEETANYTANLGVGDVITAPWAGTVSIFKNLFEVKPTEALGATSTVEVKYPEVTADYVKAENMNQVVLIKGLSIEDVDTRGNIKFTIGDDVVPGYNQFGIKLEFEGNTFDVVGAISVYDQKVQFQPITITEVQEPQPAEIDKVQLLGTWNWKPEEGYLTLSKGEGFDWTGTLDLSKVTQDQEFKLVINGKDWIGSKQLTLVDQNNLVTVAEEAGSNFILNNANSGFQTYTITAKWQANANAAEGWTLEIAGKDKRVTNTYTAYFSNTGNWENVYAYAYAKIGEGDATQTRVFLGDWPGTLLTNKTETGLYKVEIEDSYAPQFIIFNNGIKEGEGAIQTENLAFENGKTYSYEKPEPQPAGDTWTVAGNSGSLFGTAWDPENTANDMTLTEGLYTWEKNEVTLAAGIVQFKVAKNHGWDEAYPEQNYELNIPAAGVYGIKITFNAETKEVKAETTGGPELNTFTATFSNTGNWEKVYAYTWTEDEAGQVIAQELGAWPGTKLEAGTDGIFNVLIQALNAPQFIIFNNGIEGEGAIQTKNLAFENGNAYQYDVPEEKEFTVQFVNNRGWKQGNVHAYAWNANGQVLGDWPGTDEIGLINTEVTYGGVNYEVYELKFKAETAPEFIIFNDGTLGEQDPKIDVNKTEDLVFVNEKQYLVLPMKGGLACSVKEPMPLDYSDNVKMYNGMPMIIWDQPMLDSKVTFKVGDALHIRIAKCPDMRSPGLQLMSDDGKTPITENLAAGLKEIPAIITIPITGAVYEWMKDADHRVRLNGQNVFIDRMTVEPDVYPAAETPAEEETTVSVWVPENAEGEKIAQEEKVEIPATPFVVVDVKKEEIVKIKATDAVAPSRGLGGAVTALAASDISILKKNSTDLLVADEQIRVSEGDSGYEFTVSDEATVTELKTNGFDIKNNTEKSLVIKAIEVQQVVVPEDIVISPESGDIAAALATASEGKTVGNITINLSENGAYTISAPIVAPASVTINGADGAVIDASALEGNFIQMAATYDQTDQTATPTEWTVADIAVKNVTIKGLKKALFYSTQKMYVANDFTIDNCIVEQAADATTIDYTKGSTAKNITVTNSTFYAPTATTKSFYSSQGGQKYTEYDAAAEAMQTFKFNDNTMYNLASGKNFFSHRQNSQKWLTYDVKKNIFVNCGKSGQAIKGMNGGGSSANPVWDIDGNIFNYDGADTSAAESTGDEAEPVKNSIAGVVTFTDAANGDFNGTLGTEVAPETATTAVGDPTWTITNQQVASDIAISPESGDIAAALATASEGKKVGNITINLTAGGAYTIGSSIVAPASVTINGADGAVIDASALEGNFIQMAATYDQTDQTATPTEWTVADVAVKNVTIKGLKKALFYSTQKMYVANDFTIDNCIVEQAADATTIDYTKGSTAKNITVTNSTFYAPTATTKSFYSSQGGQKTTEYNGDAVQTFKFENNTMYNLALGKNFFSHRQANQTWIAYTVKNNIFVNCGKSGQVIKGMNGGQSGKNPTWDIDGNIFNFDGADSSAAEDTGDADEPVKNSVKGIISFVDASNGNFDAVFLPAEGQDQPATIPGDPRWTITPAKQLYVIGDASVNGWGSDTPAAPTAMTLKDGSFDIEFTSTAANAYFAIVDKADAATWEELSGHRYGIGDGDQTITLDTPTDLVKFDNGTIVIAGAGKYKVSVSADMKVTVTKTGDVEHTYTVAGSFYWEGGSTPIFGTEWDASNTANDMEKLTDGTYKKVYENVVFEYAGNIEFKVAQDHAWDVNYGWPGSGHGDYNDNAFCEVTGTGTGTITIIFNPEGATDQDKVKIEVTGVPTGINGIDADAAGEKDVYYNLQGVRVANPGKGVYIKNGKKVLVK